MNEKTKNYDEMVIEMDVAEGSEYWGSDCGEEEGNALAKHHAECMAARLAEMFPGALIDCMTSRNGRDTRAWDESGDRMDIAEIADHLSDGHWLDDFETMPDNRAIANRSRIVGQLPTDEFLNRFDWAGYWPEINAETCVVTNILAGDGSDIDETCGVYASPDTSGKWRITGIADDDDAADLRADRDAIATLAAAQAADASDKRQPKP